MYFLRSSWKPNQSDQRRVNVGLAFMRWTDTWLQMNANVAPCVPKTLFANTLAITALWGDNTSVLLVVLPLWGQKINLSYSIIYQCKFMPVCPIRKRCPFFVSAPCPSERLCCQRVQNPLQSVVKTEHWLVGLLSWILTGSHTSLPFCVCVLHCAELILSSLA